MISVKNLHKYFNRNKQNEIHVINDINLTFPKTGLVCLLGPSGSGKTTLMNVISGLDRVHSGEIDFREHKITKYNANEWDLIRNRYFGYVFQNYVLLPDLTVFQNLEFVLKMFNLTQEEINQRIDYALDAVGMVKYKKRRPTQLSGGQQQRVAIARALVKAPDVVVADEPTGNLDEKNTLQIMNIIKKVSQDCLVIMVTHERRLAEFYGDSIIELKDGQIVQERSVAQDSELHSLYDTNIYLGDLEKRTVSSENVNINYYQDKPANELALNIIYKDNTFYINSNQDNIKIKFIDNYSEVKVIEGKKPIIKLDSMQKFEYDLPKIPVSVKEKSAAIKYRDTFKMALRYLSSLNKRKKLLFVVLFLSAIIVVSGFVKLYSSTKIDEHDFLFENRNLIEVKGANDYDYADYLALQAKLGEAKIIPDISEMYFTSMAFNIYAQTRNVTIPFPKHSLLPLSFLNNPIPIYGQLPTNPYDIVIDKWIADEILESDSFKTCGGLFYEQIIGQDYYKYYDLIGGKIVGIVDTNNPTIYTSDEMFYINSIQSVTRYDYNGLNYSTLALSEIVNYFEVADFQNELNNPDTFTALPKVINDGWQKTKQVLVSKAFYATVLSNEDDKTHLLMGNGEKYLVIGVVDGLQLDVYIHPSNFEELSLVANDITEAINVYSLNKEDTIPVLEDEDLRAKDKYQINYEEHYEMVFDIFQYIISIIILVGSLIFLYFIMRSSLISRVYEVGVYRALGVKKSNVYRLFVSEIVLISIFSSLIGVIASSIFIAQVNNIAGMDLIEYPWFISVVSLVFLFFCNLIIGLIPVATLLRLTPSQILSKYDI
ncbi:MAG: ATP-binding cassette domain-containing protein [Bacilli bacterium]